MKKTLSLLMLCLMTMLTYAHEIWIETKNTATLGSKHEVRVYFGDTNAVTLTDKWFSDLKDVELILTSPSGKVSKLSKTAQDLYYSAYFDANEKGVYTVSCNHLVKDSFRGMKIRYQSVAYVSTDPAQATPKKPVGDKDYFQLQFTGKNTYKMIRGKNISEKSKATVEPKDGVDNTPTIDSKGNFAYQFDKLSDGEYLVKLTSQRELNETYNGAEVTTEYIMLTFVANATMEPRKNR